MYVLTLIFCFQSCVHLLCDSTIISVAMTIIAVIRNIIPLPEYLIVELIINMFPQNGKPASKLYTYTCDQACKNNS